MVFLDEKVRCLCFSKSMPKKESCKLASGMHNNKEYSFLECILKAFLQEKKKKKTDFHLCTHTNEFICEVLC